MNMCPVVHFELPGDDKKRLADFYASAFGWKADFLGPEMGNYIVVTTTETGEDNRPKNPGAINGGIYQRSNTPGQQHPSIVIAVEDIPEAMDAVKQAGGSVNGEPMDIPGVGTYVSITDTEGNFVGILKPSAM